MKATSGIARVDKNGQNENAVVAWVREKTAAMQEFYTETRNEMKRVTWPTRKQVQGTTIVVIATVFFFGGFFLVADTIVGKLVDLLFRRLAKG